MLNANDVKALFSELSRSVVEADCDVTIRDLREPYAFLTLTSRRDPDDFAVVWSNGHSWFHLNVAGGFYSVRIDDGASDIDAQGYLEQYLRAASAYIAGDRVHRRSRFFGLPFIEVQTVDGPLELRRNFGFPQTDPRTLR